MNRIYSYLIVFVFLFFSGVVVFGQVREVSREERDHIYYKGLEEQGYSRQQVDSMHKAADPNFVMPIYASPAD
jgi:hypothetical protein